MNEQLDAKKMKKIERKNKRKEKRKGFWSEFKKFITRGNVVDLSVGVVIGGAFSKIVTSFTNGIVMPFVGKLIGKASVTDLKWILTDAEIEYVKDEAGNVIDSIVKTPEVAILWGQFLQNIIDFLLIALVIFVAIKIINGIHNRIEEAKNALIRKEEETPQEVVPEAPKVPTLDEQTVSLLSEIRDLLKKE